MIKITFKNILLIFLYSIPNTVFNLLIIHIINTVVTGEDFFLKDQAGFVFFGSILLSYILTVIFQKKIILFSKNFVYDNELRIFKALQKTSLEKLEKYGTERIYSIVEDIRVYIFFPDTIVTALNSALTLIIYIGYLIYISSYATLVIVILLVLMIAVHFLVGKYLSKKVEKIREYNDKYFKYVEDAIKGFKQLKISKIKSKNLFNKFLRPNREEAKAKDIELSNGFLMVNLISQYGLFLILGTILFILPAFNMLNSEEVISFLVIFLFILNPIMSLLSTQDFFTRVFVAEKRIDNFFNDFRSDEEQLDSKGNDLEFESMNIKNLCFEYTNNKNGFVIDSLNVSIEKGETIFITGGNGSGKTTFINLLSGLYKPTQGELFLNNNLINNQTPNYKELFSIVFSDSHIFSENYDEYSLAENKSFRKLLEIMKLNNIILDTEENFPIPPLSSGQTKRMLMILALLEKKPIIVLDEWAAEQDPHFRKYFYKTLLPLLKKEGKTVIAITHDDEYFNCADRIIKFEYGKIVSNEYSINQTY